MTSYHVEKAKAARAAKLKIFNELKSAPCTDCKTQYHYSIMEYDHIENNKVASVSWLINNKSWQAVLDEIEKCELVCANCHRLRTWSRLQT